MHPDGHGLSREIEENIPQWALDTLEGNGLAIFGGNTPPDLRGAFVASPHQLTATNIYNEKKGQIFSDFHFIFNQVDFGEMTLKFSSNTSHVSSSGNGGWFVGRDNKFSVFVLREARDSMTNSKAQTLSVLSGTIRENGIEDYQYGVIMLDDLGDPYDRFIENGEFRIFNDLDGFADRE